MVIEAGSKKVLDLLLAQGKYAARLDSTLLRMLDRRINEILAAPSVERVSVGGDYRLWFTISVDGTVILEAFDQGNH